MVVENCVRLYRGSMHDTRVGELLTAEVVSNMLGAFELNCVGITVESPVEDLSDEVRSAQRRAEGGGNGTQKQILDVRPLLSFMDQQLFYMLCRQQK